MFLFINLEVIIEAQKENLNTSYVLIYLKRKSGWILERPHI